MKHSVQITRLLGIGGLISLVWASSAHVDPDFDIVWPDDPLTIPLDSPPPYDGGLIWPIQDPNNPMSPGGSNVDLNPSGVQEEVIYNPETGTYEVQPSLGGSIPYGFSSEMDLDEYMDYDLEQSVKDYWEEKKEGEEFQDGSGVFAPSIPVKGELFDRIFGGNSVDIRPQGSAELSFALNISRTDNPQIPVRQRRITTFDFNERIQLNVIGNIGEKMKLSTSYNTEATFDFENQMKLEYTGYEDEIIKKIEAGNVSLPLSGTLITGSQSLFGIKTQLQFGRLTATTIFSQQRGKREEINVSGGAQVSNFELKADQYEANKHYFLAHHFREDYDRAMSSLPSPASGINITRIEVWITNTNNTTQNTRNVIAFNDIGEASRFDPNLGIVATTTPASGGSLPSNARNNIYASVVNNSAVRGFFSADGNLAQMANPGGFDQAIHYEKLENARMLQNTEYTYNSQLGFISLNQALNNDEVLAVAFEYTFQGETYQVGELSTDGVTGQDAIILKLLKGTFTIPKLPIWDLMMKNVYSIGAFQVNRENFQLNLWYTNPDDGVDINYLPYSNSLEGTPLNRKPLLQVLDMDRLNLNGSAVPDGVFDYVDNAATQGGTINAKNGRIFFPVVEPFGEHLESKLQSASLDPATVDNVVFRELYDSTLIKAQQRPELNRFWLKGTYQSSSSSEISLNTFNIPQGAVTVTAGGVQLTENTDFTVDYTLGRVKILNQGLLESGTPIKVSLESNSLFNIQTKRLMGTHLDYRFHEDFNIGATVLNLTERPLTQKVNFGDEPISNTMVGFNVDYRTESQFLTTLVDRLPFLSTLEKSSITASGEYAHLFPGHSKAIGDDGTSYIDDFEGSQSTIDIRSVNTWSLASTPGRQPDLFPEGDLDSLSLIYGMNRAKFAWYVIDPSFFRDNSNTPQHIRDNPDMVSNHYMREVLEQEVFPQRQIPTGQPPNIPVFDMAFYPSERGPYNFDADGTAYSAGLTPDGRLAQPETRWGGIMRELQTTDFEASNIEFIQVWVMDPFHYDNGIDPDLGGVVNPGQEAAYDVNHVNSLHQGGKLYFNLGSFSEDVLRDGRKSFENGLTTDGSFDAATMANTIWGRVPTTQAIVNAFDNDPNSRVFQDVGLDGLRNPDERDFYANYLTQVENVVTNTAALNEIRNDPAGDNYNFFFDDDYDAASLDVLTRYKKYNGLEGNSPTSEISDTINGDGYPTSAITLPNIEDINGDNNLSTTESYFQYSVDITPQMLNPNNVGNNFITDAFTQTVTTQNGLQRQITWYQLKIPIRDPEKAVNNIQDFRSIRFIRMFAQGFEQPIYMRFARLELVRGEWRRYDFSLQAPGEYMPDDPPGTTFNISAVNIEENSNKTPVNYTLPPGITREINAQTTNLTALNEQSMVLEVCNLQDGDARACFRNIDMDMRSYKRLKMFVHAEADGPVEALADDDLTVFVRLGTDFNQNYYEYEIPAKVTDWNETDPDLIWPTGNEIDIEFSKLIEAKRIRNSSGFPVTTPFTRSEGDRQITVLGSPNLADVKTVMIGVRNPKQDGTHPWKPDDGLAKCAEVWVNELRLTDFDEQGGWAATARVNAKLADLGNVAGSVLYSTPGWGSIEKRVSERSREEIFQFDASSTLELGRFFGEKTGIRMPLFLGYAESYSNPQFDPLNPDQELAALTGELTREEIRDRKKLSQSFTKRRSMNLTNIRKERGKGKKAHFYDIANLSLSYSYSEIFRRDINTEFNTNKTYRGGLSYAFNNNPKQWKPLSKSKFLRKSKWFRPLRDFNLYLGPKQLAFRTDINRNYSESQTRINTVGAIAIPQFNKQFMWNRVYDMKWDITKSLKVDFNANNQALIGEPDGRVNRQFPTDTAWGVSYDEFKDSVYRSLRNWGTTTNYNHTANVNFTWPINKLPITDWVTLTTRYSASYDWARAPFSQDSLGHTIQNSRQVNWNGQFNMTTLYNKIPYFKKVNQKYGRRGRRPARRPPPKPAPGDTTKTGKDKERNFNILEQSARILMSLKNVSFTYSSTDGILLPGYNRTTYLMGQDNGFNAPGWGFAFGEQNVDYTGVLVRDFATTAAENGWLVKQPNLNTQYSNTHTDNINARATLEPITGFRIEFTANRNRADNLNEFFRWGADAFGDSMYVHDSPLRTGSFSMSVISWRSAFSIDNDDNESPVFERFKEYREIISRRLGEENGNSTGLTTDYFDGYNGTSQEVIIPAFVAAYTGVSADQVKLNPLKMIPKPNWRINYDGLSKNEWVKTWAKSITIGHAYRSSFSIGGYTTNLNYAETAGDASRRDNISGNFIPELQITNVTITEQFSPLINFDMTLKNDMLAKVELKRDRNLSLSLSNFQMTEIKGNEIVIGTGYRLKEVKFPLKLGGNKDIESDLNLRADVSIRRNRTITRDFDVDPTTNQVTSGQTVISIKTSADYMISDKLNLRAFFDRIVTRPAISTTFPTANTNAGIALRFTLSS